MGEVLPIDSEDNYVDILTKNVNVKVFEKLSNGILNGFRDDFGKAIFSNNQRENVWRKLWEVKLMNKLSDHPKIC